MFVLLVLIAAATPPNPYLSEARVNFQAQDFTRCLKRLEQAASWKSTHPEEAEVALYRGLCRFGTGEEAQASGDFEHALRIDPAVALPAWTSPRIQTAFEQARARVGLTASPPASAVAATQPPPGVVTPTEPPRRLGKAPFRDKLGRFRDVLARLARRRAEAAYVYLDNERRPDRVTVRLRNEPENTTEIAVPRHPS